MAYVPGFDHDVFISYAVVDDEKEHGVETGWVTAFMKSLEAQLAKSIGRLGRLQPWWDRRNLAKNAPIDDQIRKALESTACMVVILSKGYLESDWCRIEHEIFSTAVAKQQRPNSRIFIVDQGMVSDEERRKLFDNILPFEFFKRDTVSGKQLLGYPEPHPKQHAEFYDKIKDVAAQLKAEFDRIPALAPSTLSATHLQDVLNLAPDTGAAISRKQPKKKKKKTPVAEKPAPQQSAGDTKEQASARSDRRSRQFTAILSAVKNLSDDCFAQISQLLDRTVAEELNDPRSVFCDRLLSKYPMGDAIPVLRGVANRFGKSDESLATEITQHLVPIRLGQTLLEQMHVRSGTIQIRFVEDLVGSPIAAETMFAAHDCRPLILDTNGTAASSFEFSPLANSGSGNTAVHGGAVGFLGFLLAAFGERFHGRDVTPALKSVESLAGELERQIVKVKRARELIYGYAPTIYVVLNGLPERPSERDQLRRVIKLITEYAPSLFFVHISTNPYSLEIESEITFCASFKG